MASSRRATESTIDGAMSGAPPTPPALVPQQTFVAPRLGAPSGEAGYEDRVPGMTPFHPSPAVKVLRSNGVLLPPAHLLRTRSCVVCCVIITTEYLLLACALTAHALTAHAFLRSVLRNYHD